MSRSFRKAWRREAAAVRLPSFVDIIAKRFPCVYKKRAGCHSIVNFSCWCTLYFPGLAECRGDDLIHVVILVFAKPPAEDHALLPIGKSLVLGIERRVLLVVDRVIRLITRLPRGVISNVLAILTVISRKFSPSVRLFNHLLSQRQDSHLHSPLD